MEPCPVVQVIPPGESHPAPTATSSSVQQENQQALLSQVVTNLAADQAIILNPEFSPATSGPGTQVASMPAFTLAGMTPSR